MYKVVSIILASVLLLSCNNKATIDLTGFEQNEGADRGSSSLVGKWELTDVELDRITHNPAITDEELSEEEAESGSMLLEFFANKKLIMTLIDDNGEEWPFEGKYTLSANKKTLTIEDDEDGTVWEILSLTPTTFVYREKGFVDFFGEVEEFWLTYTFTKK